MKKGDHAIKAVRYTFQSLYPQGYMGFRIEEGETYHSDDGFSVCDSVPATFKYYPYPHLTRYLEVELLSDVEEIEEHSFKSKDIRVIRVIPVKELEQDPTVVKYWEEWDKPEKKAEVMEFMQKESSEIAQNRKRRMISRKKLTFLIACLPLITVVILYIIIPLLLSM